MKIDDPIALALLLGDQKGGEGGDLMSNLLKRDIELSARLSVATMLYSQRRRRSTASASSSTAIEPSCVELEVTLSVTSTVGTQRTAHGWLEEYRIVPPSSRT